MQNEPFQIKIYAKELPFHSEIQGLYGHLNRRLKSVTMKEINDEEKSFTLETQDGITGVAMNLERLWEYFYHRDCEIIKIEIITKPKE